MQTFRPESRKSAKRTGTGTGTVARPTPRPRSIINREIQVNVSAATLAPVTETMHLLGEKWELLDHAGYGIALLVRRNPVLRNSTDALIGTKHHADGDGPRGVVAADHCVCAGSGGKVLVLEDKVDCARKRTLGRRCLADLDWLCLSHVPQSSHAAEVPGSGIRNQDSSTV